MKHRVKVTVLETTVNEELQKEYLANPRKRPLPLFQTRRRLRLLARTRPRRLLQVRAGLRHERRRRRAGLPVRRGMGLASAVTCIPACRAAPFMHNWTNDDRVMIACYNDGTRPVVFKLERIDEAEDEADRAYLAAKDFSCGQEDAYTG